MQRAKGEELARKRPEQGQGQSDGNGRGARAASAQFGRRSAVISDALKERFTKIRLTIARTSEKNASARTSCSGMPRSKATTKMAATSANANSSLQHAPADQSRRRTSGSSGARGGRRMTSSSSVSASNTSEQTGIDHHLQERDVDRAEAGSAGRTAAAAAPAPRSARARRR